jgi:HK97 family phage major capsid protein
MVDSSGMAEIRGIDIDKLAKGFADEQNVFKKFVTTTNTSAREIRWYQKTSGFLDTADTTAITASGIANTSTRSRPFVTEQSWTRVTSYVRKYFVESPTISQEDIRDTDIDILATNVRDLVRAVERQVDARIINVITENYTPVNIQTIAATADGWDDASTGNPILDLLNAKQLIRSYGYDPEGAILAINSIEHRNLINFLITVKGSSIPQFASQKVEQGVVMEILGLRVVVSENVTTDYALVFVPQRAATWKSFMQISSAVIDDPGIGKKIRVWEEGECLLTDPKAVCLITDTVV